MNAPQPKGLVFGLSPPDQVFDLWKVFLWSLAGLPLTGGIAVIAGFEALVGDAGVVFWGWARIVFAGGEIGVFW